MDASVGGPLISVSVVVVDPLSTVTSVDPTATISHVAPVAAIAHTAPMAVATCVVPVLQLAYIEIATSASMDDSGRYQFKTDLIAVADSTAFAFSRPVADTFSFLDATSVSTSKPFSDSFGCTDVCVPMLIFLRDFSDTYAASDSAVLSIGLNPSDLAALNDSAPLFTVDKLLADTFAMNDMADIGDGIAFQFDDYTNNVVTMSDGTVVVTSPAYFDTAATTDATTLTTATSYSDSVAGTDAIVISSNTVYADSATLADNIANDFSRPLSDSFTQSDTATLSTSLAQADSFAFSEAGVISIQDYVDPTYFASDYVGVSYTF